MVLWQLHGIAWRCGTMQFCTPENIYFAMHVGYRYEFNGTSAKEQRVLPAVSKRVRFTGCCSVNLAYVWILFTMWQIKAEFREFGHFVKGVGTL